MKTVTRFELAEGMELGEDVLDARGRVILKEGTVLTKDDIKKIGIFSIIAVSIKEQIDYATTHFERTRLSKSFIEFEKIYQSNLAKYKAIMIPFVSVGINFNQNILLEIFNEVYHATPTPEVLLDYLYNMLPGEDDLTYTHCFNAALISGVFATWLGLDQESFDTLVLCGYLYDVGKFMLPYDIIWKPSKLTDVEFEQMKTHTILGFKLLQNRGLPASVVKSALMHHERMDGKGYPSKLGIDQIDIFAQYIAIVDSYEAMTSARTYRESLHSFQVIENFERSMGTQYNAIILKMLLRNLANAQLGRTAKLSDDTVADIILINENYLSRPLLKNGDSLIDLSVQRELTIKSIY